jgi:hypothetical protein
MRLFVLITLCAGFPELANADIVYGTRLGIFDDREGGHYTSSTGIQSSSIYNYTSRPNWYAGGSVRYSQVTSNMGTGAWVANVSDGVTRQVGLYDQWGGTEFLASFDDRSSNLGHLMNSGYAAGTSDRYNGGAAWLGRGAWAANGNTGVTYRIGFYDAEFSDAEGKQLSSIEEMNEAGLVLGYSSRYANPALVAWLADAATGVTSRVGFYDQSGGNEFTRDDGWQSTSALHLTSSGYAVGASTRYNGGAAETGNAAWFADASGTTVRIGLHDQFGGNEFTSSTGQQGGSGNLHASEGGFAAGVSTRYNGGASSLGKAAWTASFATGTTQRIGLYDQSGGNEFTSSTGMQESASTVVSSAYIIGTSARYNGGASSLGQAAWVAAANSGGTTRIGLFDAGGGNQFTSSDGAQSSMTYRIMESGYAIGISTRYNGGSITLGNAAWVAEAATGVTRRIGLYDAAGGNEFTSSIGKQATDVMPGPAFATESGYLSGTSDRYNGGANVLGQGAWLARAQTGETIRVGLHDAGGGNEFTSSNGGQTSMVTILKSDGTAAGYSLRYNGGATNLGRAAWLVDYDEGVTRRVGLFDSGGGNVFTSSNGTQYSLAVSLSEAGFAMGYSKIYNGSSSSHDDAYWLADVATGSTIRIGLSGPGFSTSAAFDGERYAWGYSYGGGEIDEDTVTIGWVFDLNTQVQVSFDPAAVPGMFSSTLEGVTSSGIAYGRYSSDPEEDDMVYRAFLWSQQWGVVLLDQAFAAEMSANGWSQLVDINSYNGGASFLVTASRVSGGTGVFTMTAVVPEPGETALAMMLLTLALVVARQRSLCQRR